MDGCGTSPSMQTGSGTWTIPERSLKTGDRGRTSTRHTAHWAEEFSLEIVARGLYRGELAMGIKRSRPTLHSKSLFHRSKWATVLKFSSYHWRRKFFWAGQVSAQQRLGRFVGVRRKYAPNQVLQPVRICKLRSHHLFFSSQNGLALSVKLQPHCNERCS